MSALVHVGVAIALLWMPKSQPAALPGVVVVDLVGLAAPMAAPKPAARAPAPRPAETPPAPPVEAKPVPVPVQAKPEPPKPEVPKPEPPKPVAPTPPRNEVVIPKKPEREPEKPKAKPEPEPKPEPPNEVAKATPPKPPPPAPPKPAPPKQESYDDLLSDLRAERGESKPDRVARPARAATTATDGAAGRPGAQVSPEIAGWVRAVQIHVGQAWMLPSDMRGRRLMTELLVDLDARGNVLSEPRVVRSSGEARFDENAVRAIQKASPLPAPPDEGVWTIGFCPECRG